MPSYVYRCSDCKHQYERSHSIKDDPDTDCPMCEESAVKRIFQLANVSPSSLPSRMNKIPPRRVEPSWEKGIAGERRSDGSFAPYLRPQDQTPMGVKEFADNRTKYEKRLRDIKQGHDLV